MFPKLQKIAYVKGHGALGNFFFSKKQDIKMGDTPSVFIYLMETPMIPKVKAGEDHL